MTQPKIEIRANLVGYVGSTAYYHTYIVITGLDGTELYFRGGPENGGSSPFSRVATGAMSNGRGLGNLKAEWGIHKKGSTDYDPQSTVLYSRNLTGKEYESVKFELMNQVDIVNNLKVRYGIDGPNSNTFTKFAAGSVGINFKAPENTWIPGIDDNTLRNAMGIQRDDVSLLDSLTEKSGGKIEINEYNNGSLTNLPARDGKSATPYYSDEWQQLASENTLDPLTKSIYASLETLIKLNSGNDGKAQTYEPTETAEHIDKDMKTAGAKTVDYGYG